MVGTQFKRKNALLWKPQPLYTHHVQQMIHCLYLMQWKLKHVLKLQYILRHALLHVNATRLGILQRQTHKHPARHMRLVLHCISGSYTTPFCIP